MLKVFRNKNVTKIVLWAILVLILPAFVLWGTGSLGRSGKKGPAFAGTIDGKKVTFKEFAESLTSVRCQVILNYFNQPKVMETFLNSRAFIGKIAWDRLLMAKQAKKHEMKVKDADVVAYIRSHPIFMRNGVFDDRLYSYILKHNIGLDPRAFEEMVRENLEIQRLNSMLTKDVTISDEEVLESYRKENEKFKISYILFSAESFLAEAKISEAEIRDYYEEHRDEFTLPPKENDAGAESPATAAFEDVKDGIKTLLSETRARELAIKYAGEQHARLKELMAGESPAFEDAAGKLGLKTQESPFFVRSEYLEGIGDPSRIIDAVVKLGKGEISGPVEVVKGATIFRLADTQKFDEEKFAKEKGEYAVKALEAKKALYLEDWLRGLEKTNTVNIDFKDYEKYYR